jgi:hypothetical protein
VGVLRVEPPPHREDGWDLLLYVDVSAEFVFLSDLDRNVSSYFSQFFTQSINSRRFTASNLWQTPLACSVSPRSTIFHCVSHFWTWHR